MDEIKESITEEVSTTTEATNTESTSEINGGPFKAFATEEDYNKFIKSESMKRVNAIYRDLNVKSLDEIKELISFKEKYEEVNGKFTALSDEYSKYKSDNEAVIKEREDLSRQLALSRLGVTDNQELREDFIMAVDALSIKREISFNDAAEEYISRHPEFKDLSFGNGLKIGTEKTKSETETKKFGKLADKAPWLK